MYKFKKFKQSLTCKLEGNYYMSSHYATYKIECYTFAFNCDMFCNYYVTINCNKKMSYTTIENGAFYNSILFTNTKINVYNHELYTNYNKILDDDNRILINIHDRPYIILNNTRHFL